MGDIVAINHPKYGQVIKRITQLNPATTGQIYNQSNHPQQLRIEGDNKAASVSEAQMGWVQADNVIGKVIYVFKK